MMVHHVGKFTITGLIFLEISHFIRKYIMDKAKVVWNKELKEMSVHNQLLGALEKKSKILEERFEGYVNKELSFGLGQKFEDKNTKIIFNTFLRESDPLVDQEILKSLFVRDEE